MLRVTSDSAMPMVLVPKSRPSSRASGRSTGKRSSIERGEASDTIVWVAAPEPGCQLAVLSCSRSPGSRDAQLGTCHANHLVRPFLLPHRYRRVEHPYRPI